MLPLTKHQGREREWGIATKEEGEECPFLCFAAWSIDVLLACTHMIVRKNHVGLSHKEIARLGLC
jgi:hypothetical protein